MIRAIIDKNGKILEYQYLIKMPDYKEVWSKLYDSEIDRLAKGMKDRIRVEVS